MELYDMCKQYMQIMVNCVRMCANNHNICYGMTYLNGFILDRDDACHDVDNPLRADDHPISQQLVVKVLQTLSIQHNRKQQIV